MQVGAVGRRRAVPPRCGRGGTPRTRSGTLAGVQPVLLALGAVLTLGGAVVLVLAYRRGQAGRREDEQRLFRLAVGGLALGSLAFLATMMLGTPG